MHRLKSVCHLIIDMDGVLYLGDKPLPGLPQFFAFLHEHDIDFQLVTNNSLLTPTMYVEKMGRMEVAVTEDQVLTSSIATADYLATRYPRGSHVFAIGEEGITNALQQAGFLLSRRDPVSVVVGFDRDITYAKLREATLLIRSGVPFVATNPDLTLPVPEGQIPGTGAIVAAIAAAADQQPLYIGKPEPLLMEQALARMGATPETSAAVGDRPETDIVSAQRAGLLSILTLAGATDRDRLARSNVHPDIVLDDILSLAQGWRQVLGE